MTVSPKMSVLSTSLPSRCGVLLHQCSRCDCRCTQIMEPQNLQGVFSPASLPRFSQLHGLSGKTRTNVNTKYVTPLLIPRGDSWLLQQYKIFHTYCHVFLGSCYFNFKSLKNVFCLLPFACDVWALLCKMMCVSLTLKDCFKFFCWSGESFLVVTLNLS